MNFKQIETFRVVMLTGSMTVAARQLHTSQPNVSRVIGKLEAETGFRLFERTGGRVVATKEGEAFFKEVGRAFVGLDTLAASARTIEQMGTGTLRIAAAASISLSVIPRALELFSERYPRVPVVVDTSESPVIASWTASGHCDIGFVSNIADNPGVSPSILHTENAVCIMPAGHRLEKKRFIRPEDLDGERFISLPGNSVSRRIIDAAFMPDRRIMAIETPYATTICKMVSQGLGTSLINPIVNRTMNLPGIVAKPFKPAIAFRSYVLRPQQAPRNSLAEFLVSCMRTAFRVW